MRGNYFLYLGVLLAVVVLLNLPLSASLRTKAAIRDSLAPFLSFVSVVSHRAADLGSYAAGALKAGDGGPIAVHGSATLARALHSSRLVDQWNLMLFPVILGSGKRLFPTDTESKQKLTLRETRTFTNGVQLSICQPSG